VEEVTKAFGHSLRTKINAVPFLSPTKGFLGKRVAENIVEIIM